MTTQHDYAGTINCEFLRDIKNSIERNIRTAKDPRITLDTSGDLLRFEQQLAHVNAILHALEVCKRLQNGPSEGMLEAGVRLALTVKISSEYTWLTYMGDLYKAMIKQLEKEIEG